MSERESAVAKLRAWLSCAGCQPDFYGVAAYHVSGGTATLTLADLRALAAEPGTGEPVKMTTRQLCDAIDSGNPPTEPVELVAEPTPARDVREEIDRIVDVVFLAGQHYTLGYPNTGLAGLTRDESKAQLAALFAKEKP